VVDTVGVLTEGSVGVFVFEGLGSCLLLVTLLVMLASDLRSRRMECVVVEVPGRWWEVEPRGFSELVSRGGSVGGSQVGCCILSSSNFALLISLRGWRLWYSFIK